MTIEDQSTTPDIVGCGGGATRRHALAGLAVAAGALCAACSSSSSKGSSGAPTTSQPGSAGGGTTSSPVSSSSSSSADSSSSSSSAASSGGSSSAGGSGGGTLAAVSDVPVGGGKVLSDKQIVLTQPTAGDIKAFSAVCTHQGCTVGSIDNGLITCPCHGSQYKITDGSVVTGPANKALAPHQVKVENGQVLLVS